MQNAFKIILETSIYSSIMIAFVLIVKSFLSGKLSTKTMSLLWITILIRLALPITLESPVHLITLDNPTPSAIENTTHEAETITDNANVEYIDNYNYLPANNSETKNTVSTNDIQKSNVTLKVKEFFTRINIWTVAFIIWAIGAVFVFAKSLALNFDFRKKITKTNVVTPIFEEKLIQAKNILNINKDIKITESKYANIPFVYGYLKPIILLPVGFSHSISSKKLSLIILHELCHVKRGDILKNLCWLVVKSLHWFNPLVQISYKSYLENIEEVCDEVVLSHLSKKNKYEYGQSLIDIVRLSKNKYDLPLSVSFCNKKTTIRKRVIKIMNPQKKSITLGVLTLLVSLVMIFACFTTACQPKVVKADNNLHDESDTAKLNSQLIEILEENINSMETPAINTEEPQELNSEDSKNNIKTDRFVSLPYVIDGVVTIKKLNLADLKLTGSEEYFGDKILHYGNYSILESDLSLVYYYNSSLNINIPRALSEAELDNIALNLAKKVWDNDNVQITSNEFNPYGVLSFNRAPYNKGEYTYNIEGTIGEDNRLFSIILNGQGNIKALNSYPNDVDLSEGISSERAQQEALTYIGDSVNIINNKNLNLVNENITVSSNYAPMYVFNYEYRSDTPSAEEFDYDVRIGIYAATGRCSVFELNPITKNIDILQPDEAEQMAKELIAEEHYGSKDMADRLTTTTAQTGVYWGVTANKSGPICYFFEFDYTPKESSDPTALYRYNIEIVTDGTMSDIGYGLRDN